MAGYLKKSASAYACCTLIGLSVAVCPISAEELPDPTRPPAILGSPQLSAMPASGPVLQSVLLSPQRKVAIISGQTVKLGGKFGEARVSRITESEVVLRQGKDVQTLRLFPGIEKQAPTNGKLNQSAAGKP